MFVQRSDRRTGGEGLEPIILEFQRLACLPVTPPPKGATRIGVATLRDVPSRPTVLVMAAGHGTRMRSRTPKVLHPVCVRLMVHLVVAASWLSVSGSVVGVGHTC